MRGLLIVLAAFFGGGGLVLGLALALPDEMTTKATPPVAMSHRAGGMSGTTSMAARKLTIQHVQKGCHVWSDGKVTAATMRVHLMPGQKLAILDQDVDAHQIVQFGGPILRTGGPMMTSHGVTLAFPRKGVYRLGTKPVEMSDDMMEVETEGPDNELRLVVTVA